MQILVGRRRPFGTPLPTRPCIIRVSFTEWLDLSVRRLTRWYLFQQSHAVWKCSFPNIQNSAEWSYGSTWWLLRQGSRIDFRKESLAQQLLAVHRFLFPWYFHISSSFRRAQLKDKRFSISMSTTTFPYILLYVTHKRASGITVASQPIPQFTNSNNFKFMKSDLETTRMLSHASYLGFPHVYRRNLTLYVACNHVQLSVHGCYVRTSNIIYLCLSPDGHSIRIWKTSFSVQC
jgi:hypothetical protein